jgi:cytidylate kinase
MHIAICGPLGSGCTEVGQLLSKRLGLACVSTSDVVRAFVASFSEGYRELELHVRSGEIDLDAVIDGELDEILERGGTIVEGRSGFMLLDNKSVFKVLLVAPLKRRVEHIAKRRGISLEEAKEDIEKSDKERKHMVERLYDKEWLDPINYDLVINVGSKSYEEVAEILVKAIKAFQRP